MPEPVSPDIPKVPQAAAELENAQAPVAEKPSWLKRLFSRKPKTEPTSVQQNPDSHVESTTNDGTIALDKSALERTTAAMKTMYDKGEADHMQGLGDTNANPSSPTEPIDMHGFYTPQEQAAITNTQPPGLYEEIMASGTNAPNTLPQRPDNQPVLNSQGQPVTEYIQPTDSRYEDPAIPDYLKVGTPDYVIRQAKGGNYLNDPDELNRALATKRSTLAANTFDSLTQAQQAGAKDQDSPLFKTVSMGEYRMRVSTQGNNLPLPEKGTVGFDQWEKFINTDSYKERPEEADNTAKQKQAAWDARRREIEETVDGLGLDIDKGIVETVVAFNMNGLNTTASCEGHLDHGWPTPWIDIGAPTPPATRFNKESEIFQEIAEAHNMSIKEMRMSETDESLQAWQDAYTKSEANGETNEFKTWKAETEKMGHKTQQLLTEFYANREVPQNVKLYIDEEMWRVMAGNEQEYWPNLPSHTPQETAQFLTARQAEMRAFTDFLKTKYFSRP